MCACLHVKSLHLFPTLYDSMDHGPSTSLSLGFSRQEYWSGWPRPPPGIFLTHGSNPSPKSAALAGGFFTARAAWEDCIYYSIIKNEI